MIDFTDKNLPEAQAYLAAIISSSDDAIISKDLKGNIASWNPAAEHIFGYSASEIIGKHVSILIPSDRLAEEDFIIGQIKKGIRIDHFETIRRAKDGHLVNLSITVSPIKGGNGEIVGASKVARDISEIKKAERSNAYLGAIIESSDDAIISKDLKGFITSWNKSAERMFGYTANEAVGKHITLIIPSERLEEENKILTTLKTGDRVDHYETMRRTKSGNLIPISLTVSPIKDSGGKIIGASKIARDLSDRVKAQIDLKASEHFNQSIIDNSPDCIKVIDLKGNLLSLNKAGCNQMEIDDLSVCLNQPWISFWTGKEKKEAEKALIDASNGQSSKFEGFCATMKGTSKWWEVIVTPILGADGSPANILSVSRDITARRELEKMAKEAQEIAESANIAKTEFLATMSHEIRTPMNAVIGLANILAISEPLSNKQKEYIKTLRMSGDSLLTLINDLLDIAKIEAQTIELEHIPFSVTEIAQETISMMSVRADEKGLSFDLQLDCECIEKRMHAGDPTRLRQILVNLCSNALKFTDNGNIKINICCKEMQDNKEMIKITVADTGIGISKDKLDTIFQKFTQADSSINRKYGGTGLGLAITKTLTEIMGGTINVKSEVGKGSTFTISIPFDVEKQEKQKQMPAENIKEVSNDTMTKPHVLLVEDYAPNVLVARTFIESFGYECDVASNGLEALDKINKSDYFAVLMDVQMHGMNGLEATQYIRINEKRRNKPRVRIIGMTAHALAGDRDRCIGAGMDDYISKPFNPAELQNLLADNTVPKNKVLLA